MSARAWLTAVAGTAVLVFVLPHSPAAFGLAPNGTETLLLVALLWVCAWARGLWAPARTQR